MANKLMMMMRRKIVISVYMKTVGSRRVAGA